MDADSIAPLHLFYCGTRGGKNCKARESGRSGITRVLGLFGD